MYIHIEYRTSDGGMQHTKTCEHWVTADVRRDVGKGTETPALT